MAGESLLHEEAVNGGRCKRLIAYTFIRRHFCTKCLLFFSTLCTRPGRPWRRRSKGKTEEDAEVEEEKEELGKELG